MARIKYPIGIQSFSVLREGGYAYADKTGYLHTLLDSGAKYVFLSRPRRFGKSLFISTIEEFFNGRRDLFEGLEISHHEYDWQPYPVLHFDLSGCPADSEDSLCLFLDDSLSRLESKYGIHSDKDKLIGLRLKEIILQAHMQTGRQAVILVDEYDKPLLDSVDNPELQNHFRIQLRAFYSNLKSQDAHIRFAMLTGVTKFGHLSIFSDLNNLIDISMQKAFSGICGITAAELRQCFGQGVSRLAESEGISVENAYEELKVNYDGYRFAPKDSLEIYNPFSILNALFAETIDNYWFKTGTPTFLVKLIKSKGLALQGLDDIEVGEDSVSSVALDYRNNIYPILYQSGYLTIKGYRPEFRRLKLGFPNREVEQGFYESLYKIYLPSPHDDSAFNIDKFYDDVASGNPQSFMLRLQGLFADFNQDGFNRIGLEQHYQDVIFLIMKLLGFYAQIEYKTASDRIDLVVKTSNYVYVMEFKVNGNSEDAIRQIDDKGYLLPFKAEGKHIIKIGANFSNATRTLSDWLITEE